MDILTGTWSWYVTGSIIALTMFLLLYFGKSFGVSGSLRAMCSIGGAGKYAKFFDFDWKTQIWNLLFVVGTVLGGFIAHTFLSDGSEVAISEQTILALQELGIEAPKEGELLPSSIFSWEALFTLRGFVVLVGGGFMVGFGARYAGGCTSGHAISGLSALQIPSLIAVIGFFIGGLIMTYFLLPLIMAL